MRIAALVSGIACVSFALPAACAVQWEEQKSEHFILYHESLRGSSDLAEQREAKRLFLKSVLEKAEEYYQAIAADLGYPRYSEFWTWDKRVRIYIYPTRQQFLRETQQPQWSHGMADYTRKAVFSYILSENFMHSILPHEIAHLVFRDFVGFKGEIPLWLDEGVAQWEERTDKSAIKGQIAGLYANDALLSIDDMMNLDIRAIKINDRIYIRMVPTSKNTKTVLFLDARHLVDTYYLQSASLVGFLIERFGSKEFAHFCRQLRDGKSVEQALIDTYPAHIRGLDDFERQWRAYVASGARKK